MNDSKSDSGGDSKGDSKIVPPSGSQIFHQPLFDHVHPKFRNALNYLANMNDNKLRCTLTNRSILVYIVDTNIYDFSYEKFYQYDDKHIDCIYTTWYNGIGIFSTSTGKIVNSFTMSLKTPICINPPSITLIKTDLNSNLIKLTDIINKLHEILNSGNYLAKLAHHCEFPEYHTEKRLRLSFRFSPIIGIEERKARIDKFKASNVVGDTKNINKETTITSIIDTIYSFIYAIDSVHQIRNMTDELAKLPAIPINCDIWNLVYTKNYEEFTDDEKQSYGLSSFSECIFICAKNGFHDGAMFVDESKNEHVYPCNKLVVCKNKNLQWSILYASDRTHVIDAPFDKWMNFQRLIAKTQAHFDARSTYDPKLVIENYLALRASTPGVIKCGGCSMPELYEHHYKRCSGCHTMYYCSRKCQKKDWESHKPICHPVT